VVRDMAEHMHATPVFFSRKECVPFGAYVQGENIVFGGDNPQVVCRVEDVRIPGPHNLENALAATAIACLSEAPAPVIRHTLRSFAGVEHRLEFVAEIGGVRYINDSKGTNVDASLKALEAMDRPTVLIAGGFDKHASFAPLAEEIAKKIKRCVLLGETKHQIADALEAVGYHAIAYANTMWEAVYLSSDLAVAGDNVLLSPACASFDMFKDFEHRGEAFKEIVRRTGAKD